VAKLYGYWRIADDPARPGRSARSGRGVRLIRESWPRAVFLAAAKAGAIVANNALRGEFLYDDLIIAANVIHAAHVNGVEKLIFIGSSCI
jgi:nucleoside-diphosphate-sugar epimerase